MWSRGLARLDGFHVQHRQLVFELVDKRGELDLASANIKGILVNIVPVGWEGGMVWWDREYDRIGPDHARHEPDLEGLADLGGHKVRVA